jgi:hypothetical protein
MCDVRFVDVMDSLMNMSSKLHPAILGRGAPPNKFGGGKSCGESLKHQTKSARNVQ